ncbi:MAG TPA: zinc ribbon domain-containing protein [Candidatus Limiplasma sp.]|nr:zinc ribbon domain-containing protein [Candidatus Limiplasma sp.]HPS80818.1 zinc ribbon domain-containing protein [Candidatus Limiplasma sp.]
MEEKYCQSCAMPMGNTDELYGTEKDGQKSADYCHYCYQNGAFNFNGTMNEMIELCVKPMVENNPTMTEATARQMMQGFLPTLKRWREA